MNKASLYLFLFICGPTFIMAQRRMTPELLDSIRWREVYITNSQTTRVEITPEMRADISDLVTREGIRYKRALLPAYAQLDSLLQDSAYRADYERNALLPLFPHTRGYIYAPTYDIAPLYTPSYEGDIENFAVNCYKVWRHDRFIRPTASVAGGRSDTIIIWHNFDNTDFSKLYDLFFNEDWKYAVYHCKKTRETFMLGGNAFKTGYFPVGIFDYNLKSDRGLAEHAIGTIREAALVAIPSRGYVRNSTFPRSCHEVLDCPSEAGCDCGQWHRTSPIREGTLTIKVPLPNPPYRESYFDMDDYWWVIPPGSWGDVEIIWYYNPQMADYVAGYVPQNTYQKGFPYYEVKRVLKNQPQRYEDTFYVFRGITNEEYNDKKAKGFNIEHILIKTRK